MSVQTIVWECTDDDTVIQRYSNNLSMGSGRDEHLRVGSLGTHVCRSFMKFARTYTCPSGKRAKRLVKAELVLKTSSGKHGDIGGQAYIGAQRVTGNWSEGAAAADESADTENSGGRTWDNQPDVAGSPNIRKTGVELTIYRLDVTDHIDQVLPADILQSNGSSAGGNNAFYGFRLTARDSNGNVKESAEHTNYYSEFISRQGSAYTRPQIELTVEDNLPPATPEDLSPTGDEIVTEFRMAGQATDPDVGDYIRAVEFAVYADDGTSVVAQGTWTPPVNTKPTTFDFGYNDTAGLVFVGGTRPILPPGVFLRWKARVYDADSAVSAFTTQQRFFFNTKPRVVGVTVDTDTLTPHIRGSVIDPDPSASMTAVRVIAYDQVSGLQIADWSDVMTGLTFDTTYSGSDLVFGVPNRLNVMVEDDQGTWSDLLPQWITWTPKQTLGPTAMSPKDLTALIMDITPDLTIGHSDAFDFYEAEVYDNEEGTGAALWDVPATSMTSATSKVITYAGIPLSWGRIYWWRAKVRNAATTNWTEWSPLLPFPMNTAPGKPTQGPAASQTYGKPSTRYIFPTTTPLFSSKPNDPDMESYAQTMAYRLLQVDDGTDNSLLLQRLQRSGVIHREDFRPDMIENFDSLSGWTAGASHAVVNDGTVKSEGTASCRITVTAQTASSTVIDTSGTYASTVYSDFSATEWTQFLIDARVSTLTNLAAVRLYFYFSNNDTNYAYFTITPGSAGAFETKTLTRASPSGSNGTVDWAQVHKIGIGVWAGASAYTGIVYVDNLIVKDLFTAEGVYWLRTRWYDGATWGQLGDPVSFKTSSSPSVAAGAAPDVSDPTPVIAWVPTNSGSKDQNKARIRVLQQSDNAVVYDSGVIDSVVASGATASYQVQPDPVTRLSPLASYDGESLKYEVDSFDSDGLVGYLT